jgi:hypothetical protein
LTIGGNEGLHQTSEMRNISIEKVAELTNQEIADRIKNSPNQHGLIKLEDTIKIGQGYGDYDKGYPIIFNKVGKRFGAKVGDQPSEIEIPVKSNPDENWKWESYDIYN